VAGIAALLIESGIASAPALRSRLTSTAVDLGAAGRDTSFGFGLANAFRAVRNIPTSDTSPTVSLTAPAAGATVSGVVTITATATDGGGVVRVDFLVDGVVKGSDTDPTGGWSVTWDSKPATNATHTITAVATDTAGLMTTSAARTVTVKNLYGNIAVTVKNSRTKALVPGATVEVVGMGLSGVTDAYGKCTFTGILAGARTVKISAAGYTALSKSVTVSGGRTASLAVSLVPSA
jgi:hypothetical protein